MEVVRDMKRHAKRQDTLLTAIRAAQPLIVTLVAPRSSPADVEARKLRFAASGRKTGGDGLTALRRVKARMR